MTDVLTSEAAQFLELTAEPAEPLLREMAEHGRDRGFPIIGPQVGRFLRLLARLVDAERVFEFGSGFGYSAAWFAAALPAGGEIVLTDYDADNLAEAREFIDRAGYPAEVRFEAGDAMETFAAYDGPFDVVLVDHDKTRYVDAFELAREKLAPGGVVVADNLLSGPADLDTLLAVLHGEDVDHDQARGLVAYAEHVRDDPAFETSIVPLGSGVAVSTRR